MLRITTAVALALGTALAAAQAPQPDVMFLKPGVRMTQGCPPPPVPAGRGTFNFSLNAPAEVVEGAPYSGVGITEVVNTLADGNRIVNKNTMRYYRDSQGRTRTEYELAAVGPFTLEKASSVVTINDPVAGKHYVLHEGARRADVFPGAMPVDPTEVHGAVRPGEGRKMVVRHRAGPAGPEAPPADVVFFAGPATGAVRLPHGAGCAPDARKLPPSNPLGERVIEGIKTVGSALTFQIPAGEVGNEQPITVRSEQWFSPELRVVVASTHRDPLAGDTTYRLEQINRAEPDPSLFTVPQEYAKNEMPAIGTRMVVGTGEGGSFVGLTTQAPRAVTFGVKFEDAPAGSGARVLFVRPGSVADLAGVRAGDSITRMGTKEVRSSVDVVTAMEAIEPGARIAVSVMREGKPATLDARF